MPDEESPVISVKNLEKIYTGGVHAVKEVSFDVLPKQVVVIIGSSGSGKSTVLRCINRLIEPTEGEIFLEDVQINSPSTDINEIRSEIGMVFQSFELFMHLKVLDNVTLGLTKVRGYSKEKADGIARAVLAKVDMSDKVDVYPGQLSGGQKQRFTLAASLVNDPEVVFLDEPTTGLDPLARRKVWELIERMHEEGRTIVLTTHYMEEAQHLCERVAVMDAGAIIALDSPSELIRGLSTPFQIRISTSIPVAMDDLAELPGVQQPVSQDGEYYLLPSFSTEATLPALLQWLNDESVSPLHLEVISATLEDVFLKLTGKDLRD